MCTSSIDLGIALCKCIRSSFDLLIIDLGASNFMNFNKFSFTNIQTIPYPIVVSLLNADKVKVKEYGDSHTTSKFFKKKYYMFPISIIISFQFNPWFL